MHQVKAFVPCYDSRVLFHTARATREAEFDYLMVEISQHIGRNDPLKETLAILARELRGGIYPAAVDAFLKAADYLREYRHVLTGAELDLLEKE